MKRKMLDFSSFLVEFRSPCEPVDKPITKTEENTLLYVWKKQFDKLNVDFAFAGHVSGNGDRRISDPRNKPPISVCEFNFVMKGFFKKWLVQLKSVVADVAAGKIRQKRSGRQGGKIPEGEFEGVIMSRSTNVNIPFAVKPTPNGKYPVQFKIITIMRKKDFKVTKGAKIFVEGVEYEYDDDAVFAVE